MTKELPAVANCGAAGCDTCDPMTAQEVLVMFASQLDAGVVVCIGGISIDVCHVAYLARRECFVLHLHPADLAEAIGDVAVRPVVRASDGFTG